MKKILFFLFGVFTLISFSSCKEKNNSRLHQVQEFTSQLNHEDTVQMLKISDHCMELLKGKHIDEAMAMLNEYDDSLKEVRPLTKETEQKLRNVFRLFPVLDYRRDYFSFQLEGCNDVKYIITFAEESEPEKNGKPETAFMFNPVKVQGSWFLCVKGATDEIDPFHK